MRTPAERVSQARQVLEQCVQAAEFHDDDTVTLPADLWMVLVMKVRELGDAG
jgi:hypothetical protein